MLTRDQDPVTEPTEYYWAVEPDPKLLVNILIGRRDSFFNQFYGSEHFNRIARSWRYYNGLYFNSSQGGMEIQKAGEDSENALLSINVFRSHLHMMKTYICQNRPAWDTKAINSDDRSMQEAKLMNDILDYYMDHKGVEAFLRKAVEESLIFSEGYIKVTWDQNLGDDLVADPQSGQVYTSGDISLDSPTIFDVVYDHLARRWDDSRWVLVRSFVNRWELEAQYPELREDILNVGSQGQYGFEDYRKAQLQQTGSGQPVTDYIDLWEFYHERTPACPSGRFLTFVGDTPLQDGAIPYSRKPVFRITPSPYLITSHGYTPAFDLQGMQEALNAEISTIITNHKNLGPTKIWVKTGEPINLADLEPGVGVIQTETEPKPINLSQTPREIFQFTDQLARFAEYVSGINAVAHGQPQESLRSAAALALIDQKALQYNSPYQAAYYWFLGEIGTFFAELLKQYANSPRVIYVAGINNRSALRKFQAQDLQNVSRVTVVSGNPMAKTTAGRKDIATDLLQAQLIKTPEEYLTLLQTGQIRPMVEANDAQLTTVHDENEKLRQGQQVEALITDNHAFHVLKHQSILDSVDTRMSPLAPLVLAHMKQHMQMLVMPETQWWSQVLGYPLPLPAMPSDNMPQGGEGEANPGNNPSEIGTLPGPESVPPGGPEAQQTLQNAQMEVNQ